MEEMEGKIPGHFPTDEVAVEQWRQYPNQNVGYKQALGKSLADKLDLPEAIISDEQIEEYKASLISAPQAADLVNLSPSHRLWPELLDESGINPELSFRYRTTNEHGKRVIATAVYFNQADAPKLLLAARKYERPENARTIAEIAGRLGVAQAFIADIVAEKGLELQPMRDPETLEFDNYLGPESLKKLLLAIKGRRDVYEANRRGQKQ